MKDAHKTPGPCAALLEEALQLSIRYPNELITVWGLDRLCYYASPSAFALEGYTPQEMMGSHYADIVVPQDLPHLELARSDAELTNESKVTLTVRKKSGEPFRVTSHSWRRIPPTTGQVFFISRITAAQS